MKGAVQRSTNEVDGETVIENTPVVPSNMYIDGTERIADIVCRSNDEDTMYYKGNVEAGSRTPMQYFSMNFRAWLPNIGALVSLLAVFFMSFSDIMVAIFSQSINPIQISLLYALGMSITTVTCTFIHSIKDESLLRRRYSILEWCYLLPCAVFDAVALTLFIAALKFISVGDATSVFRTMPVFSAILGRIFLKQHIRYIDYLFIAFCISGVTLIARPSFLFPEQITQKDTNDDDNLELLGISFALLSAACFASAYTLGSKISDCSIPSDILVSLNSSVYLLLISGVWLSTRHWDCCPGRIILSCIVAGGITGVALIMIFWSFTREKVIVVSVILASNVIFNNILQVIVMRIIPHWLSGVGALLILTACVGMAVRRTEQSGHTLIVSNDKSSA